MHNYLSSPQTKIFTLEYPNLRSVLFWGPGSAQICLSYFSCPGNWGLGMGIVSWKFICRHNFHKNVISLWFLL